MEFSRRRFMQWSAAASALAIAKPGRAQLLPFFGETAGGLAAASETGQGFQAGLFPSQKEIWDHMIWMAKLGPKFTGNKAHTEFVEFLATNLKSSGMEVTRDHYTLPLWEAKRWEITVNPAAGQSFKAPVTSYWPYSGLTDASGVTGELVYAGMHPSYSLSDVKGKIAYVDFANEPRLWGDIYQPWGMNPPGTKLPPQYSTARSPVNSLLDFQKAGALGVILGWTNISDGNAADQYSPFGRALQNIPGLYVGHKTGAKLKSLAGTGAKATVVLEATVTPDTPTDTLIATLPGMSSDEVIIVNTHTDGSNALEEDGGVGIVALAKYFSKIPKAERKRTIVFVLASGHFAGAYVPSIRGVIKNHPDIIQKAVAAVAVEHLGAREWADDESLERYFATGQDERIMAITKLKSTGDVMTECLNAGVGDRRAAIVNPVKGGFFGEGSGLAQVGIPTIGFIPDPTYLCAAPANCLIEKLSSDLMYAELQVLAHVIHRMDGMSAADLKA